jgi:hypothetical protein
MKVDKEALLKNKFWILLGGFALLWLISLSVLWAYAGSPADEAKKKYDASLGNIKKYPRPKNDSFLPKWVEYGDTFKKHKNEVWQIAWDGEDAKPGEMRWVGQKGMYTWPSSQAHDLQNNLAYPDNKFSTEDREWYKTKDVYMHQFDSLYYQLKSDPEQLKKGQAPYLPLDGVAFKGNNYYGIMKPIDWSASSKAPEPEECWLAQEDFWVEREVLNVIQDALASASHMDPVEVKENLDSKYLGRQVFRNASWQVELLFDKNDKGILRISPDSKITNVHVSGRSQDLSTPQSRNGVWFRLNQGGAPYYFAFEGERLASQQSVTMGKGRWKDGWPLAGGNYNPSQSAELEELFDPTNSPITEIDDIAIAKTSHKQANRTLLPTKEGRYGKKDSTSTGTPKDAASPTPPGTTPPSGTMTTSPTPATGSAQGPGSALPPGMDLGKTGTGQQTEDLTANKELRIHRNRYLFVTDQSRHLPLAVTVIMDQSHLNELLAALANSRLRFQTTQVEFRRTSASSTAAATAPGERSGPATYGNQPGYNQGSASGPTALRPSYTGTPSPSSMYGPSSGYGPPGGKMMPPMPPISPPDEPTTTSPGVTPGTFPGTTPTTAPVEQENPNLIEVTVYGIASLYEHPREQK